MEIRRQTEAKMKNEYISINFDIMVIGGDHSIEKYVERLTLPPFICIHITNIHICCSI